MNTILFVCILATLACIYLFIGKLTAEGEQNNEEYFLGGRKLGFFSLTMTLLATQIGGGALIGASEEAFQRGWVGILYSCGLCLGLLLLACGFGAELRKLNLSTMAEIFEVKYQSRTLRKVASLLSVLSLFFILVASGLAVRKFLISLGLDQTSLYLGFWCVVILYTVMGGLKAVVYTDIVQTLFFIGCLIGTFFCSLASVSDFSSLLHPPALTSGQSIPWTSWLLMPLLFVLTAQDMGQRCFSARSPKTVSIATATAAIIVLLFSLIPVYFGILGKELGLTVAPGGSVLLTAVEASTSSTVLTFFACAVLMAIISTADSLLCSISSNLAFDFTKFEQKTSQGITFLVGMLAVGFSYAFENVVPVMVGAYEAYLSVLFVPITMAVIVKNPNRHSATLSMLLGAIGFAFFQVYETNLPKELINLGLSYGGYFIGMLYKHELRPSEI